MEIMASSGLLKGFQGCGVMGIRELYCLSEWKLFGVTWRHTLVAISSLLLLVLLISIKIMKAFLNARWIRNPFKCIIFILKVMGLK